MSYGNSAAAILRRGWRPKGWCNQVQCAFISNSPEQRLHPSILDWTVQIEGSVLGAWEKQSQLPADVYVSKNVWTSVFYTCMYRHTAQWRWQSYSSNLEVFPFSFFYVCSFSTHIEDIIFWRSIHRVTSD